MIRRLFPFVLVASLVACSGETDPASAWVSFPGATPRATQIGVQVADSDDERAHGLMGVTTLPDKSGMAFVWDSPTTGEFWMKNTLIPLSIAFVDENDRIVTIRDMEPCSAEPCPKYGAEGPYVMAVEANVGFFDRYEIEVGDRAVLEFGF